MAEVDTLDDTINKLAEIAKPLVLAIEASVPTTKDHYGAYMVAIDKLAGMIGEAKSGNVRLAIAVAIQRAGANKAGVRAALRVMGVI